LAVADLRDVAWLRCGVGLHGAKSTHRGAGAIGNGGPRQSATECAV
jgi:hypothetical protein